MEWIIDRADKQDQDMLKLVQGFAYKKPNLPESILEYSFFTAYRLEDAHIAQELNQILKWYFEVKKNHTLSNDQK